MARLHIPLRLLLLIAPFTTAIPASSLFARQSDDTICPSAQSRCPPSLPTGFCCGTNDRCIPLAGNTTVLCCPKDNTSDCDKINPITCNVEQQSPQKNPLAPIKTSVFDVELEKCGDATCCPYGFSCEDGKICSMNKNQDKKPGEKEEESTTTTGPSTTEPTSSPSSSAGQRSTSAGTEGTPTSLPSDEEDQDNNDKGSSGPDTTTIIGGVVGGIAALLAIAIILFVCARRRANRRTPSSTPSGTPPSSSRPSHNRNFSNGSGPRGNIISEPIMQQNAYRTDFILKNPGTTASVASTPQIRNSVHPHISTIRDYDDQNPFASPSPSRRDSMLSTSESRGNRPSSSRSLAPIRGMRGPRTPRQQPSCESINVFADPGTVERQNRFSMGTTVSGLMIGLRGESEPEPVPARKAGARLNVPGTTPRI
ncbi:hypothetical protein NLU13_2231 [Sarocladium strictum]|uniref:Mid2 domain-containing protein n=1 Tax=Sarocladium strictum TaxID=5046 RepID=A0AA39GSP6_SARSR|nr:hypothetical protein NLU13_2231 [Sarocladium strictum]